MRFYSEYRNRAPNSKICVQSTRLRMKIFSEFSIWTYIFDSAGIKSDMQVLMLEVPKPGRKIFLRTTTRQKNSRSSDAGSPRHTTSLTLLRPLHYFTFYNHSDSSHTMLKSESHFSSWVSNLTYYFVTLCIGFFNASKKREEDSLPGSGDKEDAEDKTKTINRTQSLSVLRRRNTTRCEGSLVF